MNYINDYNNMTDEELISIIRKAKDPNAENTLISRYDNIVKANASRMFIFGGDADDVFQEGRIGLYKAVQNYDENVGSSFKTFANLCIKRHLISTIKTANRQKNAILNNAISIDSTMKDYENKSELIRYIRDERNLDPQEIVSNQEYIDNLYKDIFNMLSPKEEAVFKEYLSGKSYAEIADILNIKIKSVDTALFRIKRKINSLQENELND